MRFAIFITMFVCFYFVSGNTLFAQMINLSVKNAPLPTVIKEIEKQSNYSFVYTKEHKAMMKPITIKLENTELPTVLNLIFKDQKLEYTISDKYIVIKVKQYLKTVDNQYKNVENNPVVSDLVITGVIKDNQGKPLDGATVAENGTLNKVITNISGEFKLKIKHTNAVLVVSYIGYLEQLVTINNNTKVNVSLIPINQNLEDVVVVGYGTVRKSDLTGSVAKLKVEGTEDKPITSVDQLIQGRVSGVQLTQNSGAPGSGMTFLIRGATSFTGSNQPLFIIDGYPVETGQNSLSPTSGSDFLSASVPPTNPLAAINPNDIESIEILKDASSTAIYGSRGANGVVLITTKRGKIKKDQISFSTRADFSKLPKKIEVLRSSDYMDYVNEAKVNSGFLPQYNYSQQQKDSISKVTNFFWQDLIYQPSVSNDYQLSVLGGDNKTKYSISGNYRKVQGIVKNSSFSTGSLRLNIDRQVTEKLKIMSSISANLNVNKAAQQSNNNGDPSGSVVIGGLIFSPLQVPYNNNEEDPNTSIASNPLTLISKGKNVSTAKVFLGNVKLEYKVLDGLSFLVNTGANSTLAVRNVFQPVGTFLGSKKNGAAVQSNSESNNYLIENTFNYNKSISSKHRINAVVGYSYQYWNSKVSGLQATDFASQALDFNNLTLASNFVVTASSNQSRALSSYLGRINYSFDNRFLITATARADGSSVLAQGHQWAVFPSLAFGWNLNNEAFLKGNPFVSNLKLRASYGLSGNQSVGVGASVAQIGTLRVISGGNTITSGLAPISMANDDLKWETTGSYNVGLEGTILQKKITFSVDLYHRETKYLLVSIPIPGSNGFSSYVTNGGSVNNDGLDVELGYLVLDKKFRWNVNGNISFNRNEVMSIKNNTQLFGPNVLSSASLSLNQPINTAVVGSPIGAFFGYKTDGIYQNASEIAKGPIDSRNPTPGSIRFKDINGDGNITPDDRTVIGNPYPKYTFGVTNSFNYKAFSLSILIMGNIGQKIANLNRAYLYAMTLLTNSNISKDAWQNRWHGEGTSNYYPAPTANGLVNQRVSDYYIEDGSFVRIKNLTFSYLVPMPKKIFINSCKAFVTATNLLIFTKYKGYDPEVSAFATSSLTPGCDFGTIPQYRTFSGGVNIVF